MPSNSQLAFAEKGLQAEANQAQFAQQSRSDIAGLALERQLRTAPPGRAGSLGSEALPADVVALARDRGEATSLRGIIDAFTKTCQRWQLEEEEQLILLGYKPHDIVGRRVLAGHVMPSSHDFQDRIGYVVGISLGLGALFGEIVDAERGWLNEARKALNGKSPLDYMLDGHMLSIITVVDMVAHERGI